MLVALFCLGKFCKPSVQPYLADDIITASWGGVMQATNIENVGITILQAAALVTLILLMIRCVSRDVESTVIVCIQTWQRLSRSLHQRPRPTVHHDPIGLSGRARAVPTAKKRMKRLRCSRTGKESK
jgi:hypothetical protein